MVVWHNRYVPQFYSSCPWCNAPTKMHKLSAYYCPEFIFWYKSCQIWLEFDFELLVFECSLSFIGGIIARMRALLHGQSPGVRIRILKFSECLTDIVSVFEGLNNVVDEVFSSCIIIGCLLGWLEVIIIVIDWLLGFFLGHATRLCSQFVGSALHISMASTAWFTTHGVSEP
jgi:hypothetical protein